MSRGLLLHALIDGLVGLRRGHAALDRADTRLDVLTQRRAGRTGHTFHSFLDPTIGPDPEADGLLVELP